MPITLWPDATGSGPRVQFFRYMLQKDDFVSMFTNKINIKQMSKGSSYENGGVYFVMLTVVGWTDVFIRAEYRDEIVANLNFCIRNKGLKVYAFCLMTNHLHLIADCDDGMLGKVLREFKSFTAKKLMAMIQANPRESRKEWIKDRLGFLSRQRQNDAEYQLWERDNYPEPIETAAFFRQKETYIHMNPVRAGLVLRPEDWFHSSACPECPLEVWREDSFMKMLG